MINGNIQQPMEVLSSELWSSHFPSNQPGLQGHTPLTIASTFLVQDLCHRYHDSEDFLLKLKAIGQNAGAGYYVTIRKLELELIQTGKVTKIQHPSLLHLLLKALRGSDPSFSVLNRGSVHHTRGVRRNGSFTLFLYPH